MSMDDPQLGEDRLTLDNFVKEQERARAIADHWDLTFHIEFRQLTDHCGWKSETREATEEELEMWSILDRLTPK